ncbi:copper transporter [Occultella aeris]|uniref:Copper transporter MctB n=1 Tax=Occultella aeris TaxID=2761496 RepID=A0A7M4DR76_9MICO|nr:copper transporter [Occultella aeris]VZO39970.1 Copper transporter MctB precursor [Occultella aeris]
MIDFRYHIVSLISVFLALAVGIVLGAGPLRDYIADELTGQVELLREEKEALRAELDVAEVNLQRRSEFISASAPALLGGVLEDRSVAVVELPGANPEVTEAVMTRLEQSDATVTARVAVNERWADPTERAFRSGIAQSLVGYLNPAPAADASTETILGQALGQALTLRDPANLEARSAEAENLYELLISSELITEVGAPTAPAYATVVIAPELVEEPADEAAVTELAEANVVYTGLAVDLAGAGEASVLAGGDAFQGDLVRAVRADEAAASVVTTVDGVGTITGQVTVPLAVAATTGGAPASYGFAEGVTAVIPEPTTLTPPDPATFAPGPVDAPAGSDDTGDTEPTDDATDGEG